METQKQLKILDFQEDGSIVELIIDDDELSISTDDAYFYVNGDIVQDQPLVIGMSVEAAKKIRDFLNYALPKDL